MEKQTVAVLSGLVIVLILGIGFGYVIAQNQAHSYSPKNNVTIKTNSTLVTTIAPNLNLPPPSTASTSSSTTSTVTTTINYSNLTQVLSTLSFSTASLPRILDLGPLYFSYYNESIGTYSAVAVAVNTSIPVQLLVINSSDIASYGSIKHLMNAQVYYNQQVDSGIYEFNLTAGNYSIIISNAAESNTNGSGASVSFMPYVLMALNQTSPPVTSPSATNYTVSESLTPLEKIYVGYNITSGPWTVVLSELSYPNSYNLTDAALDVYYYGVLTNVTGVGPAGPNNVTIDTSGHQLLINVPQTFSGTYAYQKWADIQLFK